MVNDGNDDKAELYDPANYNLENAVNVYFDGYQVKLLNICWFKAKKQERGYLYSAHKFYCLPKKKYFIYRVLVFKGMYVYSTGRW